MGHQKIKLNSIKQSAHKEKCCLIVKLYIAPGHDEHYISFSKNEMNIII